MIDQYNLDWRALLMFILCALLAFGLVLLCVASASAQTCLDGNVPIWSSTTKWTCGTVTTPPLPAGSNLSMTVANAGVTGTTVNRLAKLTGAPSTAVITATTDTENALGIVTAGAGTTGNATIAIIGQVTCDFDGATTAGNYVVISSVTAGKCHDGGSAFPNALATYGRVLSTNGASGAYVMELMTPDIGFQNAGNGKSKPGTPLNSFQFNNSTTFAGSNLFEEDANTVAQRNGTTNQTLNIYRTFTDANNNTRLQLRSDSSFAYLTSGGLSGGAPGNGQDLIIESDGIVLLKSNRTAGAFSVRLDTAGIFRPNSTGAYDLGSGGSRWKRLFAGDASNDTTTNTPMLDLLQTWNSGGTTFQGLKINIGDTASAAASKLLDLQNGSATVFSVRKDGLTTAQAYNTLTNCSDSAGAAACGSASAGSVVIDAGSTSVIVSTTSVTANSQITPTFDSSLGTRLSVTCNTTIALPVITARTAGTSFTISIAAAPAVNPACFSYVIVN